MRVDMIAAEFANDQMMLILWDLECLEHVKLNSR